MATCQLHLPDIVSIRLGCFPLSYGATVCLESSTTRCFLMLVCSYRACRYMNRAGLPLLEIVSEIHMDCAECSKKLQRDVTGIGFDDSKVVGIFRYRVELSISDKTDDVVFVARTAFTSYNT
ncbi:hypothetical protein DY000_02049785 [Brassica cretica]|uniref:Cysteine proteinase inhibitor n=1 Tax=Brassica cretica TaxID=69181 RepID=A0ABQ7ER68_BRACR|nr:hypothetical protein DY000_02049785 [Brassica cretica]